MSPIRLSALMVWLTCMPRGRPYKCDQLSRRVTRGPEDNGLLAGCINLLSARSLEVRRTVGRARVHGCMPVAASMPGQARGSTVCTNRARREGIVPEENSSDRDLHVRIQDQVDHIVSAFAEQSSRINVGPGR